MRNEIYLGSEQFVQDLLVNLDDDACVRDTTPKTQRRTLLRSLDEYTRVYYERNETMTAAYWSGSYTLQQIGSHFDVHYSRGSRIVRSRSIYLAKGKLSP